jgi:hypothetical protein
MLVVLRDRTNAADGWSVAAMMAMLSGFVLDHWLARLRSECCELVGRIPPDAVALIRGDCHSSRSDLAGLRVGFSLSHRHPANGFCNALSAEPMTLC